MIIMSAWKRKSARDLSRRARQGCGGSECLGRFPKHVIQSSIAEKRNLAGRGIPKTLGCRGPAGLGKSQLHYRLESRLASSLDLAKAPGLSVRSKTPLEAGHTDSRMLTPIDIRE